MREPKELGANLLLLGWESLEVHFRCCSLYLRLGKPGESSNRKYRKVPKDI